MAWRVISSGDMVWQVSAAAERAAPSPSWRLVLSFRSSGARPASFWAPYPIVSSSKSALFAQAEQIPNEKLAAVLVDHLRAST